MSKVRCLPNNRKQALADLHIKPTHKNNLDESPVFLLYLNYAVNTICDIAELDREMLNPPDVVESLRRKGDETIQKLADFFWLFREDNPRQDFPDYQKYTLKIVEKIYELRNYFAHSDRSDVTPLTVDREMYVFLGGILLEQARSEVMNLGLHATKIFKMKLFALRDQESKRYDFTRRGLIFLICLALYRDDAVEFTQCLEDMKLPVRFSEEPLEEKALSIGGPAVNKPVEAKAFVELFTFFSARRGRSVKFLEDDVCYLAFADIIGYLNKVPPAAMDYLSLDQETERLRELCGKSQESEKNKEYKYSLHRRYRDRFLSFAAAYCEMFDVLPSMRFKRLDISNDIGRKRYLFGKENDNTVHQDRHYQIQDDTIRFEFVPETHYGPIHIDSLRSAVSASTMKQLLFAKFSGQDVDAAVREYFTAYHRILETVVNKEECDDLFLEDGSFLRDFSTVSGWPAEAIEEDLLLLEPFFPQNLLRYFLHDDMLPDDRSLSRILKSRLNAQIVHADDFLVRLNKKEEWLRQLAAEREKNPEAKLPRPVCSRTEVKNPPRDCDLSDGEMIHWVFKYLNLHLSNERKFRQLPQGKQHREGVTDHEYQLLHSIIGKYAMDSRSFSSYLRTHRDELKNCVAELERLVMRYKKQSGRRSPTLSMLARAAVECFRNDCRQELRKCDAPCTGEELRERCRRFGVRPGMPLDRVSLLKTVLKIDLEKWTAAYDYENRAKYGDRRLDQGGHVVSQIPFPANFAERVMGEEFRLPNREKLPAEENSRRKALAECFVREDGKPVRFDFGAAFRNWKPNILPRDFYDVRPLLAAFRAVKAGTPVNGVPGFLAVPRNPEFPPELSRVALDKAVRSLRDVENQDKILLRIAEDYWARYHGSGFFDSDRGPASAVENPTVYDFFSTPVRIRFSSGKRFIRILPNDVNRPVLAQIQRYANDIAQVMSRNGSEREFEFYDMLREYRRIQASDRCERLDLIPLFQEFETAVSIPENAYAGKNRQEIFTMEFAAYRKVFSGLMPEQYRQIVDARNKVYHREFNLNLEGVRRLLNQLLGQRRLSGRR